MAISVEVQEILCLIQGDDGEYLAFTPLQKTLRKSFQFLQLIEKCSQLPTNNHQTSLSSHSRRQLERNQIFLMKRLAIVGCLYRWLQQKCDQLLNINCRDHEDDNNYQVKKSIQRTNLSNIEKIIKQQFIIGVRQELVDFNRFVTEELYGDYGCKSFVVFDGQIKSNNGDNLTLLKLNVLLDKIRRKFLFLHHCLLRIIEMTSISFVGDERVKPNNYYLHELFDLTMNNSTADPILYRTIVKLSAIVMQPLWTSLKRWILQQNIHDDIFLTNSAFFNHSTNSLITKNWSRLFDSDLIKLISRFGLLMAKFKQMIADQQQLHTVEMNLMSVFDQCNLEEMSWKNQHIKMKLLTIKLQYAYVELNHKILDHSEETIEARCFKIRSFYMELFCWDDNQYKFQQVSNMPSFSTNNSSLPIHIDEQIIVVIGEDSQRIYEEIFHKFSKLKSSLNHWLDCWKQVVIFGKSMANKWDYNIKLIVNRQTWIIYQIIQVLMDQRRQTTYFLSNEWTEFERHFLSGRKLIDIIEFQNFHRRMLLRINKKLESQLQDKIYCTITDQIENLLHKLQEFENITEETYRMEQGKWHEEKLQIRQKYDDYVRKNILEFFQHKQIN